VADLYEMTGRDDQRGKPRKPARIKAWADPGGAAAPVDCVIVDISEDGARVASVSGDPIPDAFSLQLDQKTEVAEAAVMWRAQNAVGVKFVKPLSMKGDGSR
jgi:PilZ domain